MQKTILIKATNDVSMVNCDYELEALQQAVGGYIEILGCNGPFPEALLIVDEEARLKDKPLNIIASLVAGYDIHGDALVAAKDRDQLVEIKHIRAIFDNLLEYASFLKHRC